MLTLLLLLRVIFISRLSEETDVIKIFSHDYYYLLQFYSHILYSRANS